MLNSFRSLCRICPSMPTEKFSSEYKTHFTWHDSSYHAPMHDGIKKQTELTLAQPKSIHEPALPRKKKYPDLAYKSSHQVIRMVKSDGLDSLETLALANRDDRARSEERTKNHHGSIRSRSVEPYIGRRHYPIMMTQSYPPAGYTPTPKMSEYRSQFAWPPGAAVITYSKDPSSPRKSISMGAIQAAQEGLLTHQLMPNGHIEEGEKSPVQDDTGMRALEEQIMEDAFDETLGKPKKFKTEYKARFKPPSKYTDGSRIKTKEAQQLDAALPAEDGGKWYEELIESRRKAGEYKIRALGTALAPEHLSPVYLSHQEELWKQVAQRDSLSALALAAVPRKRDETKGKAQKEKENFRQAQQRKQLAKPKCRSAIDARSQTQPERKPRPPSHVIPRMDVGRGRESTRHHLQRTTPATNGSLLTSPTRDKLEPVAVHKETRKADAAPTKSKSGAQSPKYGTTTRAQSAAPPSTRPHTAAVPDTKRQRPTSLSSTTKSKQEKSPISTDDIAVKVHSAGGRPSTKMADKKLEKGQEEEALIERNGIESKKEDVEAQSPTLIPITGKTEMVPLVKSPPEPTRVKSPEQILVKSPEPVKWTIPLDTGIKWTDNLIIDDESLKCDESKLGISYHPPITDTGFYTNGDLLLSEEDN